MVDCPATELEVCAQSGNLYTGGWPEPSFAAACPLSVVSTIPAGTPLPPGRHEIVYTATDCAGNIGQCTVVVEVERAFDNPDLLIDISVPHRDSTSAGGYNFPTSLGSCCPNCPLPTEADGFRYLGSYRGHEYFVSLERSDLPGAQARARDLVCGVAVVDSDEENRFLAFELAALGIDEALLGLAWTGNGWESDSPDGGYRNWATPPDTAAPFLTSYLDAGTGLHHSSPTTTLPYVLEFDCIDYRVVEVQGPSPYGVGASCDLIIGEDRCGNLDTAHQRYFAFAEHAVNYCMALGMGNDGIRYTDYAITGGRIGDLTFSLPPRRFPVLGDRVEVRPGQSVDLELVATHVSAATESWPAYWRVWDDYNRDGDFYDAGELLHEGVGMSHSTGRASIPTNVVVGRDIRLRVAVNRYTYPEPCQPLAFGDYKDFLLRATGGNATGPRGGMTIYAKDRNGLDHVTTNATEPPNTKSYVLYGGPSPRDLAPVAEWPARYRDSGVHEYVQTALPTIGPRYYRLRAFDAEGLEVNSSNVLYVAGVTAGYRVFPNPTRGALTLVGPARNARLEGTIFDALGRPVRHFALVSGVGEVALPTVGLAPGANRVVLREGAETVERIAFAVTR